MEATDITDVREVALKEPDGKPILPFADPSQGAASGAGIFNEIKASIQQQSALRAIEEISGKSPVYAAYARDLKMLGRYQEDVEKLIQNAVRFSIIGHGRNRDQERGWKTAWDRLRTQMPTPATISLIDLSYTRAALPARQLLTELRQEFDRSIGMVINTLAEWLDLLTGLEFIGLVEWSDIDVCRYHFFRHEITEEATGERRREEIRKYPSRPFGSRTETLLIRDRDVRRRQFQERHVHHIVEAKLYGLEEYLFPVPRNVAMFMDAIPRTLVMHIHIVEGTITKEEVYRRQVAEENLVRSNVLSVSKYSPGVLLGHYNLIGWSADDLKSHTALYAIQRAMRKQARRKRLGAGVQRLAGYLFTS